MVETFSMGSLLEGLPKILPGGMTGTSPLPGTAVMPVLTVSSRVTWLELDDKALLDSYDVLQEGILCDVFSQKWSAAMARSSRTKAYGLHHAAWPATG